MKPSPVNAMTIDVEDYFHAEALASVRAPDGGSAMPHRHWTSTDRVLEMLSRHQIKATLFTLGWVAEQSPDLVRRIVEEGHELAAHGYSHTRAIDQGPEAFRADIRKVKQVLEDASGVVVKGYRAPTFSILNGSRWAWDILAEEGYEWSSSVYPVRHDLYGFPDAPRLPFKPVAGSDFTEIPISTVRMFGENLQSGGGGYFRLLPYAVSKFLIRRVHEQGEPFTFYLHPWDMDPEQPRVESLQGKSRFRHYTNLKGVEPRFDRLLRDFSWGRMCDVFGVPGNEPLPAKDRKAGGKRA